MNTTCNEVGYDIKKGTQVLSLEDYSAKTKKNPTAKVTYPNQDFTADKWDMKLKKKMMIMMI